MQDKYIKQLKALLATKDARQLRKDGEALLKAWEEEKNMKSKRLSCTRATNMKKYTIELTEKQLKGFAYACRVTDRLILGQLDFSLKECCETGWEKLHRKDDGKSLIGTDEWHNMREEVERHMNELRLLCWGQNRNTYNGVHYDDYADMLYDMQTVIEHALWLEEPEDKRSNSTTDASEPMRFGNEPLMKVKVK